MSLSVKSEGEYRQDKCLHLLEAVDPAKEHGFRWHCVKCGRWMYRKNGVVRVSKPKNAS